MTLTDLAVLSSLAIVAAYPLLANSVGRLTSLVARRNVTSPDSIEQWRQKWTALLITLGREIEAGSGGLSRQDQALTLSKELMWEIIGGDSQSAAKK